MTASECGRAMRLVAGSVMLSMVVTASPVAAQKADDSPEKRGVPLTKAEREEYERKGCAPPMRHTWSLDTRDPFTPRPVEDKALVFVVRPTRYGNLFQTKLSIDGKWVGVNRGDSYFAVYVDPGEHFFCSVAENRSVLRLQLEAGKTYFLQQKIRGGVWKARNHLVLLDEAEGLKALAKTRRSTFQEQR